MRILLTGASSFTGMWFAEELAASGHEVVAVIRRPLESYEGVRRARVERLLSQVDLRLGIEYGSGRFLELVQAEPFDLFCHHAAEVANYKSPDFDPVSALKNNAGPITSLLKALKLRDCKGVLLTGSVFEPGEGAGSDGLRAVSPYGLSKGLTFEVFKYYCEVQKLPLKKFVIPNPFGPFEEFRFTSYLMQHWMKGEAVHVGMPHYVRDNIPVSLLAKAYRQFAERGLDKINPSGYPESQGAFTERFAQAMRKRLKIPCEYTLERKHPFSEPKVRINTDLLDPDALQWDEEKAWDDLAVYYEMVRV